MATESLQLSTEALEGFASPHSSSAGTQQAIAISHTRPISRDEMNLAEFPLTVLSTRSNPKLKTLEFSDSIKGKNGEVIDRSWIITGADKFGLPTSSDDEVLLGLLKLTVDDTFRDRKVFFTRYELLRILRWTTEGRSYERLQKALDRLSGVRIKATNAFYDNESKSHSTRNFGILDAYEINDGRSTAPKPSFFTWSDVLFKSFQVGFIKKLDLDFYLGLESAVTKRLYRYLDKHFWYKSKVQVNLFVLAHEKVGISRNYAYASSLRQQLDPAIEELIRRGFLKGAEYAGKGKDTEVILLAATGKPRSAMTALEQQRSAAQAGPQQIEVVPTHISGAHAQREIDLVEALVARGIREAQARRLIEAKSQEQCARVREIAAYFDQLC
ncbi:MAG: replication initiator protein A, partial [Deltaproteobacteria bacterium]|nr:replication initiator protein A [Deltaproteobacteria bacterium]